MSEVSAAKVGDCHLARPSGLPVVWLTGLSGAGKTTLGRAVLSKLLQEGHRAELLDADEVRTSLWPELGFNREDRMKQSRALAYVAGLLQRNRILPIVASISPYREVRDDLRQSIPHFLEVYVNAPLAVCERRDVKGLYRKARAGLIPQFTGVSDRYEEPLSPSLECHTDLETVEVSSARLLELIWKALEANGNRVGAGAPLEVVHAS